MHEVHSYIVVCPACSSNVRNPGGMFFACVECGWTNITPYNEVCITIVLPLDEWCEAVGIARQQYKFGALSYEEYIDILKSLKLQHRFGSYVK
jgi:hypothetical protein